MVDTIGFLYDFDMTLTEEYQQEPIFRHYKRSLKRSHKITKPLDYYKLSDDCDLGVGYMQQMIDDAPGVFHGLTNERMEKEFAPLIKLSPGIPERFERMNKFCEDNGFIPEHHVISVGILPLIKGTIVADHVKSIYSGEFHENEKGIYRIKTLITPRAKVEASKKICKKEENFYKNLGIDDYEINYDHCIVYGDGRTDREIGKFFNQRGGIVIGVFEKGNMQALEKVKEDMKDAYTFIAPRDYTENSTLEKLTMECIEDMKNTRCQWDFEIIHKVITDQLKGPSWLEKEAKKHLSDCKWCKKRSTPKVYKS